MATADTHALPPSTGGEIPHGAQTFEDVVETLEKRSAAPQPELPAADVEAEAPSVEAQLLQEMDRLPRWQSTITVRSIIVATILGALFSIISLKLGLTSGVIPSLNIGAGLLGFFSITAWTKLSSMLRMVGIPFTPQENTVIQTCVVACYGMAFNGGFGTYLIAMDQQSYENVGEDTPGNNPTDVYNPTLGRNIGYMFAIALFGVFMLVPLRKLFILEYNLPYPSGTATGMMINSFFTKEGGETAKRQIRSLGIWGAFSFLFDFFKWFWTGNGACGDITGGLGSWPTFGMKAAQYQWFFDFSQNYIGVGMLCPQIVNWSMMFGSIISWGILWPVIKGKEGDWYPAGLGGSNFKGLYGYKVFIAIAVFLGDGLYILFKLLLLSALSWRARRKAMLAKKQASVELSFAPDAALPGASRGTSEDLDSSNRAGRTGSGMFKESKYDPSSPKATSDDGLLDETQGFLVELRRRVFINGSIPNWVALVGYIGMLIVAVIVVPVLYKPAKWYMALVAAIVAPVLAIANAYGSGMTDWNMASLYGKLAIFIFAAWGGTNNGGVIAGLAVCGVLFSSVSSASDLMQDFRTGYLTLSNPRAMFFAQVTGAVLGCFVAPLTFEMFWKAFPLGVPGSTYSAPYGTIYRAMSIIGVEGFDALPSHCLALCGGFFGIAVALNLTRDFLPKKWARFVPLPMAMAIPFYLGAWLAVDMCIGAVIMLVWKWRNPKECAELSAAVASGLIAGDGIWTIPSAILAIAGANPPMCMGWSKATTSG